MQFWDALVKFTATGNQKSWCNFYTSWLQESCFPYFNQVSQVLVASKTQTTQYKNEFAKSWHIDKWSKLETQTNTSGLIKIA